MSAAARPKWGQGLIAAALALLAGSGCGDDGGSQQHAMSNDACAEDRCSSAEQDAALPGSQPDAETPRDAAAEPDSGADAGMADADAAMEPDAQAADGGTDASQDIDEDIPACGDDLERGPPGSAAGEPEATILFPPGRSYTDADTITVRGSARGEGGVTLVEVNGIAATSTDDFATWTVEVPIADGCNILRASVTDGQGKTNANAAAAAVRNQGATLTSVAAMDVDGENARLLVADIYSNAIVAFDLASGRGTIVADARSGSGQPFYGTHALAVDGDRDRALVGSWGDDVLLSIDLASGTRSVVSSSRPAPLNLPFIAAIALDDSGDTAFVLNAYPPALVAIDLESGERTLVASETVGSGPMFAEATDLAYDAVTDPAAPRLLVSEPTLGAILAVDLETGDRTLFSSARPNGAGLALYRPAGIELDAENRRLLVVDGEASAVGTSGDTTGHDAVIAVDLASGDRTLLTGPGAGSGVSIGRPHALAFDADAQRAYVAGTTTGQIRSIDLPSGKRSPFADSDVGSGRKLLVIRGLAFDRGSLLLVDSGLASVLRVDLADGRREELSSAALGEGPPLQYPGAMALDMTSGVPERAFVLEFFSNSLLGIDLASGDRTSLSDSGMLATGGANSPGLAYDPDHDRVLFTDATQVRGTAVYAIDITDGTRSVLSDDTHGTGPSFTDPQGVVLDDRITPARALVLGNHGVIAVDLSTGNRSALSTESAGGGPGLYGAGQGVIDPSTDSLIVSDALAGVYVVDLATGGRRLLSASDEQGIGPPIRAASVAVDSENRIVYVGDSTRHCIMAVDLYSGQRAIAAR